MSRSVPSLVLQNPGNIVSSALWNSGPKAMGDFYTAAPMFRGRQSSAQTFTSGTWTAVHLDATDVDTDSGHSTSVNNTRYTAQTAGWYWVVGFMAWTNSNNQDPIYCALYVNGSIFVGTGQCLTKTGGAGGFSALSASGLVHLHAGDYVEVWARQDTGANYTAWTTNFDLTPCMNLVWVHN
jgi:hypothetical protein